MESGIVIFLKLMGALALFLYGMKLMSESLQKLAGNKMREILAAMTSNRYAGILTGLVITALIQSSSATTVMVVSFVNAGLMELVGAIGVIMGANIGTTVTGWLVSVFGLGKISMSDLALPILGCALPLLFAQKRSRKTAGELVVGFAVLFIAIRFLNDAMPSDLHNYPGVNDFVQSISYLGFKSWMIFLFFGTVLTMIFQSSSATMALTLVLCYNGWIGYEDAAAMVMGENIGTTITANLAAMVANVPAKRAALAHLLINVFGVIWIFCIFRWSLEMVADLCMSVHIVDHNPMYSDPKLFATLGLKDAQQVAAYKDGINIAMPTVLAVYNTIVKSANVLILMWFDKGLAKLVTKMIPQKEEDSTFALKHIKTGLMSTPEASLFQAKEEIALFGKTTREMFQKVVAAYDMKSSEYEKAFDKFQREEDASDDLEVQIADYLTLVSESRLATESSKRVRSMFRIVSEIESVADSALNLAKAFKRRNDANVTMPEECTAKLKAYFAMVDAALAEMCSNLEMDYKKVSLKRALELEAEINHYRNTLKGEHIQALEEKKYNYPVGVLYSDMFMECEKAGDFIINVTEAILDIYKD
ncbi:MAG: Na/Pi cotransporter family protein [Marinifilaceae bacterium]|nr:Na/Pi cotransporter family protein [Marinifilaceae bacterium]